jgi:epoxyqueuosine reductase
MDLASELTSMVKAAGASVVGIASLDRFEGAPRGHHPAHILPDAKAVITFGIGLLSRVMEFPQLLKNSPFFPEEIRLDALQALFYGTSGYDIVNDRLNQIALTLANHLEGSGYPSVFFPATYGHNVPERLTRIPGMFSQRHAAVRAGLGEFGLNNVVVTPKYGPRIRFNSVITAAALPATPLLTEPLCRGEECGICVEACPGKALAVTDGAASDVPSLLPLSRTDWGVCRAARGQTFCQGLCLRVCPVGRSSAASV